MRLKLHFGSEHGGRPEMIESLFVRKHSIAKHLSGPLLKEREEYLQYLSTQEMHPMQLQDVAMDLLHIIRVMGITDLRMVEESEIRVAAERWAQEIKPQNYRGGNKTSAIRFSHVARRWFRYLGLLTHPAAPTCRFDSALSQFIEGARLDVQPETSKWYVFKIRRFLIWLASRHNSLSAVTAQDINDFLESNRISGHRPKTIAGQCQALRAFFYFAEKRGWCQPGLGQTIRNPPIRMRDSNVTGPSWAAVRRLIKDSDGPSKADRRAKAVLLLCSIYALRSKEVTQLTLSDFDWYNETFIVRRRKSGPIQQFPIQHEVGEAIIQYLQTARPECRCRHLFVTHHAPYRPLRTLYPIINIRMKRLGIESAKFGPHSLRHACATALLRKGTALKDIASFLGHRNMDSVSIYAKYDSRMLRAVAAFSLGGVR